MVANQETNIKELKLSGNTNHI